MGKKRLFVCCDGTMMNSSGTLDPLSNVARLARSVDRYGISKPDESSKAIIDREPLTMAVPQVVYYSAGVGSKSKVPFGLESIYSGITGKGIENDILEAYCFLCNNYNFAALKDEIILVGFSRGAYTVRCLADFISKFGLLRRKNLTFLNDLFHRWTKGETGTGGNGAQGDHSAVPSEVENAFFALSLDEKRPLFRPMPYEGTPPAGTKVKQCAFSGCHKDIGGGNQDAGLSTISLLWMIAEIENVCDATFDREALLQTMLPKIQPLSKTGSEKAKSGPQLFNLIMSEGRCKPT
ncbi:hypothetical protein M426DRAFT_261650 [Hypoxylon sp. CI-4A]|nr:hypothetical protein M426DRAFT_261650 [Hypoxylon sp. CI-4A]